MGQILYDYCRSAIKTLQSQFEACAALTHGSSLGSVREQVIRDLLANHLPSLVHIVSGQIFDAEDSRSTQQDAIIILNSMSRLPFASGIDLVYAEGVVSTIEIKSGLSAADLKKAGKGIASVRALKASAQISVAMGITHNWPQDRIFNGIITYGGSSFAALSATLKTMSETEWPDFILDLSKGSMIRNHGLLLSEDKKHDDYIEIVDAAYGFMLFLTFLTEITGTLSARGINWRAYFPSRQ